MQIERKFPIEIVIENPSDMQIVLGSDVYSMFLNCLRENIHLLPRWCELLTVRWEYEDDDNENDCPMSMDTDVEYRQCTLVIGEHIFDIIEHPSRNLDWFVVHELLHVTLEQTLSSISTKEQIDKLEATVCDLTDIILRDRDNTLGGKFL